MSCRDKVLHLSTYRSAPGMTGKVKRLEQDSLMERHIKLTTAIPEKVLPILHQSNASFTRYIRLTPLFAAEVMCKGQSRESHLLTAGQT